MQTPRKRPSIDSLKKQAQTLKKAAGITHCQALHAIAKNQGYNTWLGLRADYEKHNAL